MSHIFNQFLPFVICHLRGTLLVFFGSGVGEGGYMGVFEGLGPGRERERESGSIS